MNRGLMSIDQARELPTTARGSVPRCREKMPSVMWFCRGLSSSKTLSTPLTRARLCLPSKAMKACSSMTLDML